MTDKNSSECPSEEKLRALLADNGDDNEWLVSHVEACDVCQSTLERFAQQWTPQGDVPEELLSSGDSIRLEKAIEKTKQLQTDRTVAFRKSDSTLTNLLPDQLGGYAIVRPLGRGGMGAVFEAFDDKLQRPVAIKTLLPQHAMDEETRARFLVEARAAARIQHSNVVTVHAVEESTQPPYLVQELISGESLDDRLTRGPLSADEAIRLARDVASGLEAAHGVDVIHRDIKPANIFLASDGSAVVGDFGLAKVLDQPNQSRSGTISGTPEFLAPEQARGEAVDARSDLFSLGTVLYYALSGVSPFRADNAWASLTRVCEHDPPEISTIRDDLPVWLSQLVSRLMHKVPNERFPTAASVIEAIEKQAVGPVTAVSKSAISNPVGIATACIGLAALLGAIVMSGRGPETKEGEGQSNMAQVADDVTTAASEISARFMLLPEGIAAENLADAVARVSDGGTIELRGDGRIECEPISIEGKSVTIRSVKPLQPMLSYDKDAPPQAPFLQSDSNLTLEGLDIEWEIDSDKPFDQYPSKHSAVHARGDSLQMKDCRINVGRDTYICSIETNQTIMDRCELQSSLGQGIYWHGPPRASLQMSGSLCRSPTCLTVPAWHELNQPEGVTLRLSGTTIEGEVGIEFLSVPRWQRTTHIEAEKCLFALKHLCLMRGPVGIATNRFTPEERLRQFMHWARDDANAYAERIQFLARRPWRRRIQNSRIIESLEQWLEFWGFEESTSRLLAEGDDVPDGIGASLVNARGDEQ